MFTLRDTTIAVGVSKRSLSSTADLIRRPAVIYRQKQKSKQNGDLVFSWARNVLQCLCQQMPTHTQIYCRPGGRGEGTRLLLALDNGPLTMRPFRDGAPFLLLIETPPTYICYIESVCESYRSPSWFVVCGHHLSPRIAIVFSPTL